MTDGSQLDRGVTLAGIVTVLAGRTLEVWFREDLILVLGAIATGVSAEKSA